MANFNRSGTSQWDFLQQMYRHYRDGNMWHMRPAVDQNDQRRRRPRYEVDFPDQKSQRYNFLGEGGSGHKRSEAEVEAVAI